MQSALASSGFVAPVRTKYTMIGALGDYYYVPNTIFNGTTNLDICIPNGIVLQNADTTIANGNARIKNVIDFQVSRSAANQIAQTGGVSISSHSSGILCGRSNLISYYYAQVISGNENNVASNGVMGGTSCTTGGRGNAGIFLYGSACNAGGGNYNIVIGQNSNGGTFNDSNWVFGISAGTPSRSGLYSYAGGSFAANADCNHPTWMTIGAAGNTSTTATPITSSFNDGGQIGIPASTSARFNMRVVARTNTATGSWATAERMVTYNRGTTTSSMAINDIQTIGTDRGSNAGAWPAGWGFNIIADTSAGLLRVFVTGSAGTNVRWQVSLNNWLEVSYP